MFESIYFFFLILDFSFPFNHRFPEQQQGGSGGSQPAGGQSQGGDLYGSNQDEEDDLYT